MNVLFVCTGNTCRSAMAQALAQKWADEHGVALEASSAGLAARESDRASQGACAAMRRRGISLEGHRARCVTREMLERAQIVLTMSERHREALLRHCAPEKVFTLCAYAGEEGAVEDPFGGDEETYEHCARRLEGLIDKALRRAYGVA